MKLAGNRENAPHPADHQAVVRVELLLLLQRHADCGHNQEQAEQNHDPLKADQRRARRDKEPAKDHRSQYAVEQHFVLVPRRDREVAEHQDKHEHVVHRERFLHHVSSQKLQAELPANLRGMAGGGE